MASTYSTNLALELIGTGDQSGTWGATTNTNLGTLIEQAVSGYVTQAITDGADTVVTIPNGATGVARNMYLELTGTLTGARNLIVPVNKKLYFIYNNTSGGYAVTVKVTGQTGVSVPNGKKMVLVSNGTDIVEGLTHANTLSATTLTIPSLSTGTISGTTVTASTQFSGPGTGLTGTAASLNIGGNAATATSATSATTAANANQLLNATWSAPAAIGNTTAASGAFTTLSSSGAATLDSAVIGSPTGGNKGVGTINAAGLYINGVSVGTSGGTVSSVGGTGTVNGITLSGTVTSSGNLTLSGAVSGVSLTTAVSGTLPLANGGTGQITAQAAINSLAGAQTSGQYLRGNGTNVVMSAIQAGDVPTLNQNTTGTAAGLSATLAIASGGTGQITAQAAINSLAGAQTTGYFLRGNGTNVIMDTIKTSDVPTLNQNTSGTAANVTGVVATANGGTGQSSYTDGQLLIGNTTGNTLAKATLTAGSGISITNGSGTITIASSSSGGTVTSVGLSLPSFITVTNSPVTGSGTLTGTLATQSPNLVFAGPSSGGAVAPTFRSLVSTDIPTLNQNTTGSAGSVTSAVTFDTSGGAAAGTTYNGSAARTISYSTVGAFPATATTGSGNVVLSTSPTLVTPALGTPSGGTLSSCTVDGTNPIGYLNIPQNAQSTNYSLASSDRGKHIYSANSGAQTITVPTNATVSITVGAAITIVNNGTTAISFTTTGTTVYKAGTSAAWASGGTLAVRGMCTLLKVDTDTWFINGTGLS